MIGPHPSCPSGPGRTLAAEPERSLVDLHILAVNGHLTDTAATIQHQIWAHHPGQLAHVTWMHGSEEHSGGVALTAGPAV